MPLTEIDLLQDLGWMVITAALFAYLGRLLKMPSIVSYIFAGIALGPVLDLVEVGQSLYLISKLGIALLLFLVGLELSFDKIRDVGRVAVVAGLGQVVFTALGGLLLCLALGFNFMASLFLAVGLTFSSTVVVVKLLDQKGDLSRLYGRIAVGIFLVQDLVVIAVLTLLSGLDRTDGWSILGLGSGLGKALGGMLLLLAVVLLASRFLLPRLFGWASRSPDTIFIWALFWCLLTTGLAGLLGLSLEVGAFLAGVALAQSRFSGDLHRRLHPLMSFFVAIFFVTLGIRTDLSAAVDNWQASLILSLFVLVGNPLIFMIIIVRMGYSEWTAFRTSLTVAQISEFSFIFATMGLAAGLVDESVLSITTLVGIVTIAVSAYMIIYTDQIYAVCRRAGVLKIFRARAEPEPEASDQRRGHMIVVGMNALGREIVRKLVRRGEQVLAVDTDPAKLDQVEGAETFIGNVEYESVLEEIGLPDSRLVISALQIEDFNQLLAYRCRSAGVPCAIHAFDPSVIQDLVDLEVRYLLSPSLEGVVIQHQLLQEQGLLAEIVKGSK
ncbi:MAG: cation:proton antiporter [Verrucomicrobiota bacterium]